MNIQALFVALIKFLVTSLVIFVLGLFIYHKKNSRGKSKSADQKSNTTENTTTPTATKKSVRHPFRRAKSVAKSTEAEETSKVAVANAKYKPPSSSQKGKAKKNKKTNESDSGALNRTSTVAPGNISKVPRGQTKEKEIVSETVSVRSLEDSLSDRPTDVNDKPASKDVGVKNSKHAIGDEKKTVSNVDAASFLILETPCMTTALNASSFMSETSCVTTVSPSLAEGELLTENSWSIARKNARSGTEGKAPSVNVNHIGPGVNRNTVYDRSKKGSPDNLISKAAADKVTRNRVPSSKELQGQAHTNDAPNKDSGCFSSNANLCPEDLYPTASGRRNDNLVNGNDSAVCSSNGDISAVEPCDERAGRRGPKAVNTRKSVETLRMSVETLRMSVEEGVVVFDVNGDGTGLPAEGLTKVSTEKPLRVGKKKKVPTATLR